VANPAQSAAILLRLCDVLGIDLEQAMVDKIEKNTRKCLAEKSRGSAVKYTHLTEEELS
jgi:hypothetical protein